MNHADTRRLKWVHRLSKSEGRYCSTINFECEDMLQLNTIVAWVNRPIARIHPRVAQESNVYWDPDTQHITGWLGYCQECHGRLKAVPILVPVDVEKAYHYIASPYNTTWWNVWSHWCRYASLNYKQDGMEWSIVLRSDVWETEAVQIVWWRKSIDGYAFHLRV
jgi:hypothetical protein